MTRYEWNFADGMNCGERHRSAPAVIRKYLLDLWEARDRGFYDGLRAGLGMGQ